MSLQRSPRDRCGTTTPTSRRWLGPYDAERLSYTWISAEPSIDVLQLQLAALVEQRVAAGASIADPYLAVRAAVGAPDLILAGSFEGRPRLTEPWFC